MRSLLRRIGKLWRSSLLARIVATSIVLSMLAISVVGGYLSIAVGSNLFEQRRDEALMEAVRATEAAQRVFSETVASTTTGAEMDSVRARALSAASGVVSNRSETLYAMLRTDAQGDLPLRMGDVQSQGFDDTLITDALRDAVASSNAAPFYQSIRLETASGSVPGLIVGSILTVPQSGQYEYYLVTSLADVQDTLGFMQRAMLAGGIALVALVALVTWLVVRMVVGPVEQAAKTSALLAAGHLDERMPVQGEDVLADLGRNFNEMADSMSAQITKLATLSTLQQRFVSDVSHELRTPLTTIRLAGEVLSDKRDELDPVAARTVELLQTQVQRFDAMLADLLELSRFDAGAASLDVEATNLVQLAQAEIDAISPLAHERGSELRLAAPGGHFQADVDPRRIRRILQNFLGNAVDHGEGRPITVTIDSNTEAIALAVRDHGVGMSAEQVQRVFDRFWRADPSRQRRTGGTGLGLAISQDDAALHGGWIDVWSEDGKGAAFRLTLPRTHGRDVVSPIALPPADTAPVRIVSTEEAQQ